MSERNITVDLAAAVSEDVIHPLLFVFADFPAGAVRIWTGYGDISWDGETWQGLGHLMKVDAVSESTDSSAEGISIEVDGFQDDFFNPTMLGDYQGSEAKIWFAGLDEETEELIEDPYLLYSGFLDSDEIIDTGKTSKVTMLIEHRLADLLRPRSFRYTYEDQQTLYPNIGDKGLEFVAALQEIDLKWGRL